MSTLEEDLHAAAAKVTEALEERARRAWRLGTKLEDMPIGIGLTKAFAEWSMIDNVMRNAEPKPESEPGDSAPMPAHRAPPSKTHPWRTNPVKRR